MGQFGRGRREGGYGHREGGYGHREGGYGHREGGYGGRSRFGGEGRFGSGGDSFAKPVKEGDEYDVEILEVGSRGDGIAKIQNFVIFVPGVQKGDKVKIRITQLKAKSAVAEVVGGGASGPAASEPAEEKSEEASEPAGENSEEASEPCEECGETGATEEPAESEVSEDSG